MYIAIVKAIMKLYISIIDMQKLWFNLLIEPCENILSFDPAWFCKPANRVAEAYGLVSDLLRKKLTQIAIATCNSSQKSNDL